VREQRNGALSSESSKAGRLQRAALDALLRKEADDVLPTNARFVFYELEHVGIVRKSKPGEKRRLPGFPAGEQDLGDALFYLRDKGIVPWAWITDETRSLSEWPHAPSVAAYLRDRLAEATLNPWGEELPPLILVESRSLSGVLRRIAYDYCCPIAATNGQVGGFLRTDVAPLLGESKRAVLYLGDHDHQGDQIERNTRNVLEREIGWELSWQRLALTEAQIDERGLDPIWKRDGRYRPPREQWAWETEVLGQREVLEIVRAELDARLPEPLAGVREREAQEREEWRRRLA